MVGNLERLFFGYSEKPEILRETMHAVANRLSSVDTIESSVSWEDLRIDGRLIVNEVENEIDKSTVSLFEVSTLNDNVLFELGLAIGRGKSVGILLDSQDRDAARRWRDFGLLSSVGYTGYKNSDELLARVSAMASDPPDPLLTTSSPYGSTAAMRSSASSCRADIGTLTSISAIGLRSGRSSRLLQVVFVTGKTILSPTRSSSPGVGDTAPEAHSDTARPTAKIPQPALAGINLMARNTQQSMPGVPLQGDRPRALRATMRAQRPPTEAGGRPRSSGAHVLHSGLGNSW